MHPRVTRGRAGGVNESAAPYVPAGADLAGLARAAQDCRGCELFEHATQTVFGAGPADASLMLVGEQPGDVEDHRGEPFVGPAGGVLRRALSEVGLDPAQVYVTNAVKHFRFKSTATGKRRIHEKPAVGHILACEPWLAAELRTVAPRVVVALGAVAARALLGPGFAVTRQRGTVLPWPPAKGSFVSDDTPIDAVVATIHPSAVLRARDDRDKLYGDLVSDLRTATGVLADLPRPPDIRRSPTVEEVR